VSATDGVAPSVAWGQGDSGAQQRDCYAAGQRGHDHRERRDGPAAQRADPAGHPPLAVPHDTGSPLGDLTALARVIVGHLSTPAASGALPVVLGRRQLP
jgi:hypothetical protein